MSNRLKELSENKRINSAHEREIIVPHQINEWIMMH